MGGGVSATTPQKLRSSVSPRPVIAGSLLMKRRRAEEATKPTHNTIRRRVVAGSDTTRKEHSRRRPAFLLSASKYSCTDSSSIISYTRECGSPSKTRRLFLQPSSSGESAYNSGRDDGESSRRRLCNARCGEIVHLSRAAKQSGSQGGGVFVSRCVHHGASLSRRGRPKAARGGGVTTKTHCEMS